MADARPLSPWAQRFGHGLEGREAFLDDAVHHSGFAPEQPRLHPKYYADKLPPADGARTASQLDRLFASEAFQNKYLRGCHSWMAGPLMRYVRFSKRTGLLSGGHRAADYGPVNASDDIAKLVSLVSQPDPAKPASPADPANLPNPANPADSANPADPANTVPKVVIERREDVALKIFHLERIQVDESKWLPFIKKDRWMEWDKPQPLLGGGNWSVDNPKVWEVLRISIELLDRVVKALIADKHIMLETVLYGMNCTWEQAVQTPPPFPGANLLLSRPYLKSICDASQAPCPLDFVTQFTPEQWTTRLEHLLRYQTWTFVEKYNNYDGIWGITTGGLGNLIIIDAGPIRRLMGDDITLAERCMLQFMLMATMLHEMFHGLYQSRKVDRTWPADLPPINLVQRLEIHEPLLDSDAATEMGYAAEQRIFGGQFILGPRFCEDLPFGVYIMSWPNPYDVSGGRGTVEYHPTMQAGSTISITRVPALFTSRMLSAEFWDDASIPQKSADYFHSKRLFVSDTTYPGIRHEIDYNVVGLTGDAGIPLEAGEPEMIGAWLERSRDWDQRRAGWYEQARREWLATPWSEFKRRQLILRFGRSFAQKDRTDCRYIAQELISRVAWGGNRDLYIQDLPPIKQNNNWVFHAIGLLMLAALPIQNTISQSSERLNVTYHFIAGKETAEALKPTREVCRTRLRDDREIPPSVLYDPLGQPGQVIEADHFFHEHILDVLGRLIEYLAISDVAVSGPWLREIMNAAEDLRRQRRDARLGTRGKTSWAAAWSFAIPAYDTSVSRFQNGQWTEQI